MRGAIFGLMAAVLAGPAAAQGFAPLFVSPVGEIFRSADETPPLALWLAAADADGDGRLSQAEYLAGADAFFARADANGDGAVTSLESQQLWRREAPELFAERAHPGAPERDFNRGENPLYDEMSRRRDNIARRSAEQFQPLRGAQGYGLLNDIEPLMSCDGNFDRRVNRQEFQACALRRFVQIDADRDGFYAPGEGAD